MFRSLAKIAARFLAIILFAGAAALLVGVPAASAHPNTPHVEPVPGVTLDNLWQHCNAAGGETSDYGNYAYCILPTGQTVWCTPAGCVMFDPAPRQNISVPPAKPTASAPANTPTKVNLPAGSATTTGTSRIPSAPTAPTKAPIKAQTKAPIKAGATPSSRTR